MAPGGSGMKVPEEFVCSRRKGPYRNVDGVMRQNDDFEFEIVAFELFRMIVVVRYVQDDWALGRDDQILRGENMLFQVEDIGGGCLGPDGGEVKNGCDGQNHKSRPCQERQEKDAGTARTQGRSVCPVGRDVFSGRVPGDGAVRIWEILHSPVNMTAR